MLTARACLDDLARLRREQCDVLTRRQLERCGITHDDVRTQIRAGRWRSEGSRVVVLHNGPLTVDQRRWCAVLAQPTGAALAGASAAEAHGLQGFTVGEVHVLTSARDRLSRSEGVVVHVSRRFSRSDVHPIRSPPMVRIERAVVDAACWDANQRRASAILIAAVQQRLTTPSRLRDELLRAGHVRHRRLLRQVIADIEGGAQSLLEIDFGALCARAGIPRPIRQAVRVDAAGRRRYLDVDCDGFSVEVDGAVHLQPLTWLQDAVRHNELTIVGQRILRVPSVLCRTDPEAVVDQLRRAHRRFAAAAGQGSNL